MGKEFYFETDDKLDRKKYAEFLKTLLEHCDEYRREDSDGAYVIAIDSPWGTGKTRFAKMFRNFLEDRTKEMGDDSAPGDNASVNAIYYNSWDTDFSNDALQPLIHAIINSPEFKKDEYETASKEIYERFKKTAIAVAKVVGLGLIHHYFGETAKDIVSTIDISTSEKTPDPLEEYQSKIDILQNFKKSLQELIAQKKHKKLIIIIDELDRCRPIYAIQTLEIAKHLFSVRGLVFIFALDIKQLSCSVKTVYGQEMDAPGYLCRFFDYVSQLPLPEMRKIITNNLIVFKDKGFFSSVLSINQKNEASYELGEFIYNIAANGNLSIRECLTLFKSYEMMMATFLRKYNSIIAFMLYFFLIYLKFKNPDIYSLILSNKEFKSDWDIFLKEKLGKIIDDRIILDKLVLLNCKDRMKDINFGNIASNIADHKTMRTRNDTFVQSVEILSSENGEFFVANCVRKFGGISDAISWTYPATDSFDQILFFQDLKNWEQIKELTLPEYYHQQLEMFNFALPIEGSEA